MTRHLRFWRYIDWTAAVLAVAGVMLLAQTPNVSATCRTRAVVATPVVVVEKKVVVAEVVAVATFAPIAIAVQPVYGAAYVPPVAGAAGYGAAGTPAPPAALAGTPAAPAAVGFNDAQKAWLRNEIRAVVSEAMGKPAPKADAPPMPKADTPPPANGGLAIFANRCSSCHTAGKLAAGTTFEMFASDGKLKELTDRQWGRVGSKVATAQMPPPAKDGPNAGKPVMSDEEAAAVADWLDKRK